MNGFFPLSDFPHIIANENNCYETEQRQENLASKQLQTACCAVILEKRHAKPCYIKRIPFAHRFTNAHVGFNPNLNNLVNQENDGDDNHRHLSI